MKKAHLNPVCDQDVNFELPEEANPQPGKVGKLIFWLYGFRPAQAWENCYAAKFVDEANFERGVGSSVSFWQKSRDLACVVHGYDFTFCGFDEDLDWIENMMTSWFEVKVRARLGPGKSDDSEVTILGRTVRWKDWGIEYEADPRHRSEVLNYFGFNDRTSGQLTNGRVDERKTEVDEVELSDCEATKFRGFGGMSELLGAGLPKPPVPSHGGLP